MQRAGRAGSEIPPNPPPGTPPSSPSPRARKRGRQALKFEKIHSARHTGNKLEYEVGNQVVAGDTHTTWEAATDVGACLKKLKASKEQGARCGREKKEFELNYKKYGRKKYGGKNREKCRGKCRKKICVVGGTWRGSCTDREVLLQIRSEQ